MNFNPFKTKQPGFKVRYHLWQVTTIIVFVVGVFVSMYLGKLDNERSFSKEQLSVLTELSTIQLHLEGVVTSTFNLTQGMVHFISHQGDISLDLFNAMSNRAMLENRHIRNIALAPNNQVRWVYPLKGNERAVGLKYLENPQQRESVIKAQILGKPNLAGPVKLVQGGLGFINRSPIEIVLGSDSTKKYWGLASIVAHVNTILEDGGIMSSKSLKIALRGKDGKGEMGAIISGDTNVFLNNPIIVNVNVPGGKWQLAAIPINGWYYKTIYQSKLFLYGLLSTIIITCFLIILSNRNLSIKKKNQDLAHEISERNRIEAELIVSKDAAESANRMKTIFLANMSHEIRTPMNSILGFSDLLLTREYKKENAENFLRVINTSTRQLLNVINDIIDISIIETGQLKISNRQSNINSLLINIFNLHNYSAKQKNIDLQLYKGLGDSRAVVLVDDFRLTQILNNLVNNAIKFTDKGIIKFGYELKNQSLEFFVIDSGRGIPADYHNSIFERFRQVDEHQKENIGGNGLGLAISKSLVELMGGKIWLKSVIGSGTEFYFNIPYYPIQDTKLDSRSIDLDLIDLKGKTILIAEDDDSSSILFESILKPSNVNIIRARNGIEVMEHFLSNLQVDLILMDIKMPMMNGIEATKEIRKFNTTIPIVAQTAFAMSEDRERALNAGCNYFISKPINYLELFEILNKIFL
ncbi:MAG: ATP-binding protein [Tenuifilaceae bacterium]